MADEKPQISRVIVRHKVTGKEYAMYKNTILGDVVLMEEFPVASLLLNSFDNFINSTDPDFVNFEIVEEQK